MKVSVVGGGNAGVFSALYLAYFTRNIETLDVELIYNPSIPPERVGQATVLQPPQLLWAALGFNWYNNPIHATFKSGILYEGWGKINDKIFHPFPGHHMAMHYCPWEMQRYVLDSGLFKVIEGDIDPKDVDADYVIDCRGKPDDFSEYEELINPTNACILGSPKWNTTEALWSRHVATPDGWTFVIPTSDGSPSHDYCVGYCYNSNITKKEVAEYNFLEMFDVEVKHHVEYRNYVAKNPVIDDRIFLNGNRLYFLEPLESSATQTYMEWIRYILDAIIPKKRTIKEGCDEVRGYINQGERFVLWHYQFGSKYDTPFWNYAKRLKVKNDPLFNQYLKTAQLYNWRDVVPDQCGGLGGDLLYAQWPSYSFHNWYEGMTKHINN